MNDFQTTVAAAPTHKAVKGSMAARARTNVVTAKRSAAHTARAPAALLGAIIKKRQGGHQCQSSPQQMWEGETMQRVSGSSQAQETAAWRLSSRMATLHRAVPLIDTLRCHLLCVQALCRRLTHPCRNGDQSHLPRQAASAQVPRHPCLPVPLQASSPWSGAVEMHGSARHGR